LFPQKPDEKMLNPGIASAILLRCCSGSTNMTIEQPAKDVTRILLEVSEGVPGASDRLLPIVYDELRGIAGRIFKSKASDEISIQPTILVHDAFIKLTQNSDIQWASRAHFYAMAAKVTRDLLVDHVRRKNAAKRGGGWNRVSLTGVPDAAAAERMIDVIDLEDALKQLGELSSRQETIVEMRFYGGLTVAEVAEVLGVSERTVMYDWRMARAWLRSRLETDRAPSDV
jgi:RNA polymerase sigma factor (TIGR02999 family)